MTTKPLPRDKEAEEQVLGALILDETRVPEAAERLTPDDFFFSSNQKLFDAIIHLSERGVGIDFVTLQQQLKDVGDLVQVGGPGELLRVSECVTTSARLQHHIGRVEAAAQLRKLILDCEATIRASYEARLDQDSLDSVLSEHERLALGSRRDSRFKIEALTPSRWAEAAERLLDPSSDDARLSTGFADLDEMFGGGFRPGQLIACGARPGAGKTSLVHNLAANIAWAHRNTAGAVVIFSLEMDEAEILERMICAEAGVDSRKLAMSDDEVDRLHKAQERLSSCRIIVDDTAGLTIGKLQARARQYAAKYDVKIVLIDYLQILTPDKKSESRQLEVASFALGAKSLARELRIPVFALAQLNRDVEKRGVPRPTLSDLKESGAIEQDSDAVLLLWRPHYYEALTRNGEWEDWKDRAELIVAKQRSGPTGKVKLLWDPTCTRFGSLGISKSATLEV